MSNPVRNLQATQKASSKPVAPLDLWEQLDKLAAEVCEGRPEGEGWFTPLEYSAQRNLPERTALTRLQRLYRAGKLERHQRAPGRPSYYRIANGRAGH